ncbi:MAG: methyltransferase [Myxococcales bacterium]
MKGARRLRKLLDAMKVLGIDPDHLPPRGVVAEGGWGQLAHVIRTDEPLRDPVDLARFHDYLFETGKAPARELWQRLDPEGPLLDLGGGAGAYSAAFPGEAMLADTPDVLKLAKVHGKLLPLDLLNTARYPGDKGTVLLANVLHLFGEADCRAIVAKAAAALKPNGMLVVKDLDSTTAQGVLFALNMALFTRDGDVHPPEAVRRWMDEADLAEPQRLRLETSPESLVLAARKP